MQGDTSPLQLDPRGRTRIGIQRRSAARIPQATGENRAKEFRAGGSLEFSINEYKEVSFLKEIF